VHKHFWAIGATREEPIYIYMASVPVDGLQQVRQATERLKPVLSIIDPLLRLARVKDGNDFAEMTQVLEPLLVLARETRAHVLCAHHAGRMDRAGGDNILGSTAIFGGVDAALIMKRSGAIAPSAASSGMARPWKKRSSTSMRKPGRSLWGRVKGVKRELGAVPPLPSPSLARRSPSWK
jgi:hypothetical protein